MREQMVDEKMEGPSSIWKEAEDLMQMVCKHKMHEDQVDVGVMAEAMIDDIAEFPEVMFSYRELYVALRLFLGYVQTRGNINVGAEDEAALYLCKVLVSGIVAQIHQYGMECVERFATYLTEEEGEQHGEIN